MRPQRPPRLALTQGDPAGVGPEILLKTAAITDGSWQPLLFIERAAIDSVQLSEKDGEGIGDRIRVFDGSPTEDELDSLPASAIPVVDPVGESRQISVGSSSSADAAGALAALDQGMAAAERGVADALVTGPVSKESIARHCDPSFRGHTDYLAQAKGLERYGRDYLMTFLTPDLQVALLTTHLPLTEAMHSVTQENVGEALACLRLHAGGRIAVAGLNPHAGEGGLLGVEETQILSPAVLKARADGIDAYGPESADSVFVRARRGEFDWVLALYHDQGLVAVKTSAFGDSVNWTLGLPFIRTSVDHGTAFELAGTGKADWRPMQRVVDLTLQIVSGELPRQSEKEAVP